MRSLPKRFQAKKAVIQEFQDLNEIKLRKLVGKLITYEIELDMDNGVSKKGKDVDLQSVDNNNITSDSYDLLSEDDLALFLKQFRRGLKNKGRDIKWSEGSSNNRGKLLSGEKYSDSSKKKDKSLSKVFGSCFVCGGSGLNVPTPDFLVRNVKRL